MAEYSKEKLFYLKLNKDFFDQHYIKILETQPNGDKYVLFLMKLMCESISHNGYLRFNESIPYDETMLASITRTDIDVVRSAIKIFLAMEIVEFTKDKTLFIKGVPLLTTTTTKGAEKKAEQREKRLLQLDNRGTNGGQMSTIDKSVERKDKSIEIKDNILKQGMEHNESRTLKIDYLDDSARSLITSAIAKRKQFDLSLLLTWLDLKDIRSKNNPSAYFRKVFIEELEDGTFNKVVKPEPPKTDDLPSWEEMIDDLETPTKQEEVDITNKDYLEKVEKENK